jgi:hypothetical protein
MYFYSTLNGIPSENLSLCKRISRLREKINVWRLYGSGYRLHASSQLKMFMRTGDGCPSPARYMPGRINASFSLSRGSAVV